MSRSVSVSHPWSNQRYSVVLLFHNKYITLDVFAHLLNLKPNTIKSNKIVETIPENGGYKNFIALEHVKDYVTNVLHWKEHDVKLGMAQFGFQEEVKAVSTVHRTYSGKKKRERSVGISAAAEAAAEIPEARKKREVELIQERAKALIDETMNLKEAVGGRSRSSSPEPPAASAAGGGEEEIPSYVQEFLNSQREHNLTKAIRVYKASEDWKARVANAVAMRKHEIKQKLEAKMRAETFEKLFNDLYVQELATAKREIIAEKSANAAKETERLLAQAKEKNWMW